MKKMSLILRKCKSLSRQLSRSYSYNSLRSQSAREEAVWGRKMNIREEDHHQHPQLETVFVGSKKKRYVISSKYLEHPLLNALIDRSKQKQNNDSNNNSKGSKNDNSMIVVKCEVVLFDHLLWMLENADQNLILESLDELADLYLF